jgi:hypothetical protein
MNTTHVVKRVMAGTLLSGVVATGAFALSAGTAVADPGGCPYQYFCWCPGKPLPKTGAPITWDMNECHNYRYRLFGPGELLQPPAGYCPPALLSDNLYDKC